MEECRAIVSWRSPPPREPAGTHLVLDLPGKKSSADTAPSEAATSAGHRGRAEPPPPPGTPLPGAPGNDSHPQPRLGRHSGGAGIATEGEPVISGLQVQKGPAAVEHTAGPFGLANHDPLGNAFADPRFF